MGYRIGLATVFLLGGVAAVGSALTVDLPEVASAGASRITTPVTQIAIAATATSAKRLKGRDSVVLRSSIVVSVVCGLGKIARPMETTLRLRSPALAAA